MDSSRTTEEQPQSGPEEAGREPGRDVAATPVPAVRPSASLDVPTVLALQGTVGNAVVARLISDANPNKMRAQAPAGAAPPSTPPSGLHAEASALTEESRAIGESLVSPSPKSGAALQRQPPPAAPAAPAEAKPVDPAVAALWNSSVVAPMEGARQKLANVPLTSMQSAVDARTEVRTAQENAQTVASQIRDDPALRARVNMHMADIRRFGNRLSALLNPESLTFQAVAGFAQEASGTAASLGRRLPPATPGAGGATSPATSTRIIRALWQSNVTAKLRPLPARLRPATERPAAAAAGAEIDSVLTHVRGVNAAYAGVEGHEALDSEIRGFGVRLSDIRGMLALLAEGTQPTIGDLETEAGQIKVRLANTFPAP